MDDLTIILPTYNEEENIKDTLSTLRTMYPLTKIIVADDGSKDKTQSIVKSFKKNVTLLDRSKKDVKGLTVSVMDAILATKTDYFIVMDADGQHPFEVASEIYSELFFINNDVVVGIREEQNKDWPLSRQMISWTATALANIRLSVAGKKCKDVMSGLFGGRTKYVRNIILEHRLKFEHKGYKVLFDIMKYCPKNIIITYVPYEFGLRTKGTSKIGKKQIYSLLRALVK
jgi:dolichol-phosphate mannosyltransferase